MSSIKRNLTFNSYHHIYNRGVMKKIIFHEDQDYKVFIGKIIKYINKYPTELIAFTVLPNHFHFVIRETGQSKPWTPSFMQQLQNSYAKYYAQKYGHPGKLFQGTYKSKFIASEKHLNDTLAYVLENPVKHGLVEKMSLWKWSHLKGNL